MFAEISDVGPAPIVAHVLAGEPLAGRRELIRPVHPPAVQHADGDGVGGTVEGTRRAPYAVLAEDGQPVLHLDVEHGTELRALAAGDALLLLHLEQPAQIRHGFVLHRHDKARHHGKKPRFQLRLFAREDLVRVGGRGVARRLPHERRHIVRVTEDHVVRHDVVELSALDVSLLFQDAVEDAGGRVVDVQRLAAGLYNIINFIFAFWQALCEIRHVLRCVESVDGIADDEGVGGSDVGRRHILAYAHGLALRTAL